MDGFFGLALTLVFACLALSGGAGIFGFGRKKAEEREAQLRRTERVREELGSELESLRVELQALSRKLNVELGSGDGDRTTTLSKYPRRIVELKIRIDEIERALRKLGTPE